MSTPEGPCAKCGSRDIVPDALVLDRGHGNIDAQELRAGVARRPDALLFRRTAKQELSARICGQCGYTELYVENPRALLAAYHEARKR